jgi:hypothetical protein
VQQEQLEGSPVQPGSGAGTDGTRGRHSCRGRYGLARHGHEQDVVTKGDPAHWHLRPSACELVVTPPRTAAILCRPSLFSSTSESLAYAWGTPAPRSGLFSVHTLRQAGSECKGGRTALPLATDPDKVAAQEFLQDLRTEPPRCANG